MAFVEKMRMTVIQRECERDAETKKNKTLPAGKKKGSQGAKRTAAQF